MKSRTDERNTQIRAATAKHASLSKPVNIATPAIESQIRECETRLYAAMLASNVAELDTLIADDLLFAGPTGELPKRWT